MKIAFIIPKLANQAPIHVVKDLINEIQNRVDLIDVYYFDEIREISLPVNCYKISIWDKIDFDNYDVVHSHMLRPDLYIWFHRRQIKKARCISTVHNDISKNLKLSYNIFISILVGVVWFKALKSQDKIVMLTDSIKNKYFNKFKLNQLCRIYNGRNIEFKGQETSISKEDLYEINKLKSDYTVIGVSARLAKVKGFSQLIAVLPLLKNYALVFIGDGDEKENLVQMSIQLEVQERCLFLGFKKDGYRYLPLFDVFAMTSYSEGFPLGLLEAALYKLPIVCSNLPIFKELFKDNEVSFFELDDRESLQNSFLNILKNRKMFSENIFIKVSNEYNVQKMGNNYLELYHDVLKV